MRLLVFIISVSLLVCVPACSPEPKLAKVKGNLLFNGMPYVAKHNGSVSVKFIPIVESGQPSEYAIADVNREDGSFVVLGRAGGGIPPGKYRIVIDQMVIDPPPEVERMNQRFRADTSKIVREVTGDSAISIDLAIPEGQ